MAKSHSGGLSVGWAVSQALDPCVAQSEILASHARCRASGLRPKDIPKSQTPSSLYPERVLMGNTVIKDLLADFHTYVRSLGGATFYAYDDRVLVQSWDDLNYLSAEDLHIETGVDISEESLGTSAASMLNASRNEAWIVGEEHYLEILKPYTTYCNYYADSDGGLFTLVVVPKKRFTNQVLSYIRLLQKAKREALLRYKIQVEKTALESLGRERVDFSAEGNLLVDHFGRMLWGNGMFHEIFDTTPEEIKGKRVGEIFPELKPLVDSFASGKGIEGAFRPFSRSTPKGFVVCTEVVRTGEKEYTSGMQIKFKLSRSARGRRRGKGGGALYRFSDIVGESSAMRASMAEAMDASMSDSTVLILGESGTGKELFAQSIHSASRRADGPFVPINCANAQHALIESELFGYVAGAFTGASKNGAMGKIEYANGGTLFLDEIGELPLTTQTMLLRVLEERTITRLGGTTPIPVDFRLICATNRNISRMVSEGSFRLDLFYRINVLTLSLPPLRTRQGDVELLSAFYLHRFNEEFGKNVAGVDDLAMRCLNAYRWPGNLRELRNVFERAVQRASRIIRVRDLPIEIQNAGCRTATIPDSESGANWEERLRCEMGTQGEDADMAWMGSVRCEGGSCAPSSPTLAALAREEDRSRGGGSPLIDGRFAQDGAIGSSSVSEAGYNAEDRQRILQMLLEFNGNKSRVARELGISRTTLYRKISEYGL